MKKQRVINTNRQLHLDKSTDGKALKAAEHPSSGNVKCQSGKRQRKEKAKADCYSVSSGGAGLAVILTGQETPLISSDLVCVYGEVGGGRRLRILWQLKTCCKELEEPMKS